MAVAICQLALLICAGLVFAALGLPPEADAVDSSLVELWSEPQTALASQEQKQLLWKATSSGKFSGTWTGAARRRSSDAAKNITNPKMHIQVYYETRCPACVSFLSTVLGQLWQKSDLKDNLNISLYPYGNAQTVPVSSISNGYKFWHPEVGMSKLTAISVCQHGRDECFGNLIQACVIHLEPQDTHMDFVFCMSGKVEDSIEKSSYECMEKTGIDKTKIKDCAMGAQGNKFMNQMAKDTDAVQGRLGTPWILIDGQNLANPDDLLKKVCEGLDNGPHSCSNYRSAEDNFPVMFQNMLDVLPKHV